MSEPPILTSEGAARLRLELENLKGPARDELAQRLRSAIQNGDLSENADYHAAKEAQAFLEGRIQEIEYLLKNATIVEDLGKPFESAEVGARITVQEEGYPADTYHLVGAKEADPRTGKISYESPIGKALLGRRVGDVVVVQTPDGEVRLKILSIK